MNVKRYAAFAALLLCLSACSAKTPPTWNVPDAREQRWAASYNEAGESLPLTLILLQSEAAGASRLMALSAFGTLLGASQTGGGRWERWGPRGAEKLMTRLAEAVGALVKQGAEGAFEYRSEAGDWSLRLEPLAVPHAQ